MNVPHMRFGILILTGYHGVKNAVIAFKDGSRFRYENDHVTMIDSGESSTSENNQ